MKRALLFAFVMLSLSAADASSQVTVTYDLAVIEANGPHGASFPPGTAASVTYTLDTNVADTQSDPQRGVFPGAVISMSVSFPSISIFANSGPAGFAQTFDNGGTCSISDQVFLFSGPITSASTLGGESINSFEVDFLSTFVSPGATPPTMLTSDALPVVRLPIIDTFTQLTTASGDTYVYFSPPPPVRIQTLISDVERLVTLGRIPRTNADRLIDKLEDSLTAIARGRNACADLRTFLDRANSYMDDGVLSRFGGQALINNARDIRIQLGCLTS